MNQLTNEEIAKVFAAYLGQPVVYVSEALIDGVSKHPITDWGVSMFYENIYWLVVGKEKYTLQQRRLLLTSLANISDEDKKAVAKITFPESTANDEDLIFIGYGIVTSSGVLPANVYNYLINKGYAVKLYPWKKTATELGIAIETTLTTATQVNKRVND